MKQPLKQPVKQTADLPARAPHARAERDPRKLDVFELARNAQMVSGSVSVQQLPRMLTEIPADPPERDQVFAWSVTGSVQDEFGAGGALETRPFLRLRVQGAAWLTCQRCLAPCLQPFDLDVLLRLVADEAQANEVPLDDDEPDVIVGSSQFDLLELVEEELLLALPLVPKHDVCPQVHEALSSGTAGEPAVAPDAAGEPERQRPFGALAALQKKGGDSTR